MSSLLKNTMKCLCSGEQLQVDEMVRSSESLATKECSAVRYSCQNGETEQRVDTGNIEEAESSLREGLCLNYEVGLSTCPFWLYSYEGIRKALTGSTTHILVSCFLSSALIVLFWHWIQLMICCLNSTPKSFLFLASSCSCCVNCLS